MEAEIVYDGTEEYECDNCHRVSVGSDCNNLNCPFCGGALREVVDGNSGARNKRSRS